MTSGLSSPTPASANLCAAQRPPVFPTTVSTRCLGGQVTAARGQEAGTCLALTALDLQSGQVMRNRMSRSTRRDLDDQRKRFRYLVGRPAHEFGHTLGMPSLRGQPPHRCLRCIHRITILARRHGRSRTMTVGSPVLSVPISHDGSCIPNGVWTTLFQYFLLQRSRGERLHLRQCADYGTTWASCYQICGTPLVGGCVPSGWNRRHALEYLLLQRRGRVGKHPRLNPAIRRQVGRPVSRPVSDCPRRAAPAGPAFGGHHVRRP